jgi:Rrf2 family protein
MEETTPTGAHLRGWGTVRISARSDYALRAAIELAAAHPAGRAVKRDALARAQDIPVKFLETLLTDLRHGGLVATQRGVDGGYWLAKPPAQITVADVIRATNGSLVSVRGQRPEEVAYTGAATSLQDVWIAVRAALRGVVENVTLAELAAGRLPTGVRRLAGNPEAWLPH